MKEAPLGRSFMSTTAAGPSTGAPDAMGQKDTNDAWRRNPLPEKGETVGDGFLIQAQAQQSIDSAVGTMDGLFNRAERQNSSGLGLFQHYCESKKQKTAST
jgi:hypothetical protein